MAKRSGNYRLDVSHEVSTGVQHKGTKEEKERERGEDVKMQLEGEKNNETTKKRSHAPQNRSLSRAPTVRRLDQTLPGGEPRMRETMASRAI